ncbi:cytochrome c [Salipiger sp. P9]|uniref:c-type cytochrome n=1 Tax=Salipiger pentaromativorans TaxID=2943193 RepID=UPI0021586521|nr:cytochrome c [Salipiger pentaromativorans]MCR8546830.1 cytochrome c [Salipiger pentaromativorans]
MIRLPFLAFCVLPAAASAQDGATLFAEQCSACHMEDAAGDDRAPDIRAVPLGTLKRALHGFDQMPEFALEPTEIAALHGWLASLDPDR